MELFNSSCPVARQTECKQGHKWIWQLRQPIFTSHQAGTTITITTIRGTTTLIRPNSRVYGIKIPVAWSTPPSSTICSRCKCTSDTTKSTVQAIITRTIARASFTTIRRCTRETMDTRTTVCSIKLRRHPFHWGIIGRSAMITLVVKMSTHSKMTSFCNRE